jgi:hypothetical protein
VSDGDNSSMPQNWAGFWAVDAVSVAESGASTTGGTGTTGGGSTGSTGSGSGSLLYSEDFEGSSVNMGEQAVAGAAQWAVGDPSQAHSAGGPTTAASGSSCAGTKFSSAYDPNSDDLLYTPEIDFTGKTSGTLSFKATFDLALSGSTAEDGVRVLATPDQGQTWYLASPQPGYNYQSVTAFTTSSGTTPGFGGREASWTSYSIDVSGAIQASPKWIFVWEFKSGASSGHAGFFMDDVAVNAQ